MLADVYTVAQGRNLLQICICVTAPMFTTECGEQLHNRDEAAKTQLRT